MTERLKHSLTKVSRRPIEVLGAALRTHTTKSSVVKYKLLRKYRFDFVLIYHGINDLWANHVPSEDFQSDYSHLGSWYKRNVWLDSCLICRTIYKKWHYQEPARGSSGNLSDFASEATFKRNIFTLIQDIRRDGSTPFLMTFAWNIPANYTQVAFEVHSLGYSNPTNYDRWPVELWGSPDYVREGLKRHNRILKEVASSEGILLLDQEKLMGKELRWYGDVCHFSDEGTDRFIENITEFFIQQSQFSRRN
jgi:lysophospholipase L1-like esterase